MQVEHLSKKFDTELKAIRQMLLEMGGKVELMIMWAMKALVGRDSPLADLVIAMDKNIDDMEKIIDDKCLEVLATRQPAARDLRFVALAFKIVTDLERIGDASTSISLRVKELNQEPPIKPYVDLPRMAEYAGLMVKEALDAFVRGDWQLAMKVCRDDDVVDQLNDQIQQELLDLMKTSPDLIERAVNISRISRALERIGDHATNVAEMVIFMLKGEDIRHTFLN